jgi:hypothetical protein
LFVFGECYLLGGYVMAGSKSVNFYMALGVAANALWGAAFVVPYALHDFPQN